MEGGLHYSCGKDWLLPSTYVSPFNPGMVQPLLFVCFYLVSTHLQINGVNETWVEAMHATSRSSPEAFYMMSVAQHLAERSGSMRGLHGSRE